MRAKAVMTARGPFNGARPIACGRALVPACHCRRDRRLEGCAGCIGAKPCGGEHNEDWPHSAASFTMAHKTKTNGFVSSLSSDSCLMLQGNETEQILV
jgi:hypothetical protein